ncbi:MAG TPA: hypothetical protein VKB14_14950 [Actinomycetales bacterium]|nr:hypothetical protein [Actinomycetales bacterium]
MISIDLARRLRSAGVSWTPKRGDRFVVPDRDMDDDVFVVSDMVIEVHHAPGGSFMGFNGTTEWALDSVEEHKVLWLPREDQLRELIGDRLLRLERTPKGWDVVTGTESDELVTSADDVETAYGTALLALLS